MRVFILISLLMTCLVGCSSKIEHKRDLASDAQSVPQNYEKYQCYERELEADFHRYEPVLLKLTSKNRLTHQERRQLREIKTQLEKMENGYRAVMNAGEDFEVAFADIRLWFPGIAVTCGI